MPDTSFLANSFGLSRTPLFGRLYLIMPGTLPALARWDYGRVGSKAAVKRAVFRHLIGDCQYCQLRISSFDWPPELKGFVPRELTSMIGCVGAYGIENPHLNDGKRLV